MSRALNLTKGIYSAIRNGHSGVFSTYDLALILREPVTTNFRKCLSKWAKADILTRVASDLYTSPTAPPAINGLLEHIAMRLHWDKFIYVSLESELSKSGDISQLMFGHLTCMTTGRSGTFQTPFGTIEFTHTQRKISLLVNDVYFDHDSKIFRAKRFRAIADLKRVGRNVGMLNDEAPR